MLIAKKTRGFLVDASGASMVFGLFFVMGGFMFGGLALDLAYAYKSRNELQIAADAAAHAALYLRQVNDAATAKSKALDVAKGTLPSSSFGDVLNVQDVVFGSWDLDLQVFSEDPNATDAVMVSTKRFESNGNEVPTFMLNFLGIDEWNVRAESVFVTHHPSCLSQGFAANDVVDVQSNNTFYSGFCIHSNEQVSMNQNNSFEAGVIVSTPDSNDVSASGSGNDGLDQALRNHSYNLRILDRMGEIWTSLQVNGEHVPDYITNPNPVQISADTIAGTNSVRLLIDNGKADLLSGRVYMIACGGNGTLTFDSGAILKDVVILSTCNLNFGEGAVVENSLLMTRSTSSSSVTSASGFQLGRDDNCAVDGGSQILTYGSVRIPAGLEVYGSQIIARQDIAFAANADGIQGVSFIAGGSIDGTSNANIRFCITGMERSFELPYFRLAG